MSDLESLKTITPFCLLTDDIEDTVDQLGTLGIMSFCPVVSSTALTEDEVVGTEECTERTGSEGVHGSGFEIDEDGTGNVFVGWWG